MSDLSILGLGNRVRIFSEMFLEDDLVVLDYRLV
jgi:hypothetical protein